MHIVLTGGTGYIGGAVLDTLIAAGHRVTAAVRSAEAAQQVTTKGAVAAVGHLTDPSWFGELLRGADGAIHTATDNAGPGMDSAVVDAVIDAFGGTGKPYVHTGGIWVWGANEDIEEAHPIQPPAITAWRAGVEHRLLTSGLTASVVAPAIVYGYHRGIPASTIANAPRDENGALTLIGDGSQRWATVHVDDLAELYVAVLEQAPGGETYIGASGVNPSVRELAEAAAGDSAVMAEPIDVTRARLGELFADALLLDQTASGRKAKEAFGWSPSRPPLVEELRAA